MAVSITTGTGRTLRSTERLCRRRRYINVSHTNTESPPHNSSKALLGDSTHLSGNDSEGLVADTNLGSDWYGRFANER